MINLKELKNDLIENGLNSSVELIEDNKIKFIIEDLPSTIFMVEQKFSKALPQTEKSTWNLYFEIRSSNNSYKYCLVDVSDNEEVYSWIMHKCLKRKPKIDISRELKKIFKYLRKTITGKERDYIFISRTEYRYQDIKYRKLQYRSYNFLIYSDDNKIGIDIYRGKKKIKEYSQLKISKDIDRGFKKWWKSEYHRTSVKRIKEQASKERGKSVVVRA